MGRREYLRAIHERYRRAGTKAKGAILDEFCRIAEFHRKSAIIESGEIEMAFQ